MFFTTIIVILVLSAVMGNAGRFFSGQTTTARQAAVPVSKGGIAFTIVVFIAFFALFIAVITGSLPKHW
jgi:hypothetical protein